MQMSLTLFCFCSSSKLWCLSVQNWLQYQVSAHQSSIQSFCK